MEDTINDRKIQAVKDYAEITNDEVLTLIADVKELKDRLSALENAVNILSNTLHVIDATSLLALYSLIQTNNLRQPNFKSNQDIIDSGCSDAINRMLKTVTLVNANENRTKTEQKPEQTKQEAQHEDQAEGR